MGSESAVGSGSDVIDVKDMMFDNQTKVKGSFDKLAKNIITKKNPTTKYKISGKRNNDFYNANAKTNASLKFLI